MVRGTCLLALLAIPFTGCIGPDAPLVLQGAVIGGAEGLPIEVVGGPLEAAALLAQPLSLHDMSANVYEDAGAVWLDGPEADEELAPKGDGVFVLESDDPQTYFASRECGIRAEADGELLQVNMMAPQRPLFVLPEPGQHPAQYDLLLDFTNAGYDHILQAVFTREGDVVWSNVPSTQTAMLNEIRTADGVDGAYFPAEAFPEAGTQYIVALAGLDKASTDEFDGFNTFFSNFAVGAWSWGTLVTADSAM